MQYYGKQNMKKLILVGYDFFEPVRIIGVYAVDDHNPCHLGMGIVVTALVKYGDQGITIHGGIINIIIKGAKVAILIHNLPSLLSKNFLPFL